jgi:dolichyl-phosphate-mannose--protein O-mannosyl transferase
MVAIGNPALWWVSVPASLWALLTSLRARRPGQAIVGVGCLVAGFGALASGLASLAVGVLLMAVGGVLLATSSPWARDAALLFSGAGFFALYLPWGISPRTLNYSHYLFEAIPYACLTLGVLLDRLWSDVPHRNVARGGVVAYLALVLALFVLFFPFLTGVAVPADWFNHGFHGLRPWTWFRSWI